MFSSVCLVLFLPIKEAKPSSVPELYIEDNTWLRGYMKFISECSTRYLTSERVSLVRCRVEDEKRNFVSPRNHVLFCLFYNDNHFPKIFKMLPGGYTNVSDHFPNFSENYRRFPKIAEGDPKMFRLNIDKLWLIHH